MRGCHLSELCIFVEPHQAHNQVRREPVNKNMIDENRDGVIFDRIEMYPLYTYHETSKCPFVHSTPE